MAPPLVRIRYPEFTAADVARCSWRCGGMLRTTSPSGCSAKTELKIAFDSSRAGSVDRHEAPRFSVVAVPSSVSPSMRAEKTSFISSGSRSTEPIDRLFAVAHPDDFVDEFGQFHKDRQLDRRGVLELIDGQQAEPGSDGMP